MLRWKTIESIEGIFVLNLHPLQQSFGRKAYSAEYVHGVLVAESASGANNNPTETRFILVGRNLAAARLRQDCRLDEYCRGHEENANGQAITANING